MMAKKKPSRSRDEEDAQSAANPQDVSVVMSPTSGQLAFNMAMAVFGLFVAAILFSFGIQWTGQGSPAAGVGLILAGLFIFWRGGKRLSWTCAEIKIRRQK
jgi:hypothetical protein